MDNTNRFQNPLEVHGVQEILDDGLEVKSLSFRELLTLILIELKTTNLHLQSMTDEHINMEDTKDVY